VNLADVWMVQCGDRARFLLETTLAIGVSGERFREDLDRDVALEARIAAFPDLAHASGTDRRDNFIRTEPSARLEDHGCVALYAFER
jgi:hypothetical protein